MGNEKQFIQVKNMKRKNISSGTPWEPVAGYSRAVRVGPHIHVSGTTATSPEGRILGKGDPYAQSVQIISNIETALKKAGATLAHVVRTRIYVTDMNHWQEVARAHAEAFSKILPATSLIEVSRLISPNILVEIEADAYVPED